MRTAGEGETFLAASNGCCNFAPTCYVIESSGGSRISRRGGRGPRMGGRGPPKWLRFENFACQNERIWTRRGGARRARPPRSANGVIPDFLET